MKDAPREKLIEVIAELAYDCVVIKLERDKALEDLKQLRADYDKLFEAHEQCDS